MNHGLNQVPEPLEHYCQLPDPALTRPTQRQPLQAYLQGTLLGTKRRKTTTGIANTEPGKAGRHHKHAQRLQWFLSQSPWNPHALHDLRLQVMQSHSITQPTANAVLAIDETQDRKYGPHTAHVGR